MKEDYIHPYYQRYRGKKSIPDNCPQCGAGTYPWKDGKTALDYALGSYLDGHYDNWNIRFIERDEFWKVPGWYAYCGPCTFNKTSVQAWEEAFASSAAFMAKVKDKIGAATWTGGTLAIPFKEKAPY